MHSLDDYLDAARDQSGLPSDNQLASHLGVTRAQISYYRLRKTMPSPATMVRLAELARMDPDIAVLELYLWREVKTPAANCLRRILGKVGGVAAVALVLLGSLAAPAHATGTSAEQINPACLVDCILWIQRCH